MTENPATKKAIQPPEKHAISPTIKQQLAYAVPSIGVIFLMGPINIIQGIYAKYFGLSLAVIATVVLTVRLFDVVTDPIIGYFSDKYTMRTGSRKPFIVGGGILLFISSYFLFVPVNPVLVDANTQVSGLYFLLCFLAFYLGFTLYEIPHQSWGATLSSTSEGRNTVFTLRAAAVSVGLLLFYAVPLLPLFESRSFTPETTQWSVLFAGMLLLPALFVCVKSTPNGYAIQTTATRKEVSDGVGANQPDKEPSTAKEQQWRLLMSALFGNKSLVLFYGASACYGVSVGAFYGLEFIFIDTYLGMGEDYALINICGMFSALISLIVWRKVICILGKKVTWVVSKVLIILSCLMLASLTPGETSFWDLLLPQTLFLVGAICEGLAGYSLLADLIDYSTWKYRREQTATFFSLNTTIFKCFPPISAALGMIVVGWYGFDPAAPAYSADIAFGMRLVIGWVPSVFLFLGIVFVLLIPLNSGHSEIIRQRLMIRAARANRAQQKNSHTGFNVGKEIELNV